MLEAGQIQPACGKAHIRAYGKKQRFPALIEHGIPRVTDSVRDLRFLPGFHRVHEDRAQMIREQLGVRQPFAVRRPCFTEPGRGIIIAVRRHLDGRTFFHVHVPQVQPLVRVRNLLAVRRPQGSVKI